MAVALVGGVAPVHERLLALLQRRLHLLAESVLGENRALAGNKLAVEPSWPIWLSRPVGDRMLTRMFARSRARIGLAALGKIGRHAPVVGVDPLDMPGPAQRLQPADMGADEGLRIARGRPIC
jgi:hypothetical protein